MTDEGRVTAMFTAHCNGIIKACADLVGHYVLYEFGNRTDATIKTPNGRTAAKVEIEWKQPYYGKVNEVGKLSDAAIADEAESFVFVNYSEVELLEENLNDWRPRNQHMLLFLMTHEWAGGRRNFKQLRTYIVTRGRAKLVRRQYALPWDVPDTRWSAVAKA